jgi:ribosomal protein S27E
MAEANDTGQAEGQKQTADSLLEELAVKMQKNRLEHEKNVAMRKALEKERTELENEKKRFKLEEEDFYSKREAWEKSHKKKSESVGIIERNLEKLKSKIDMERRGIEIDLEKLDSERKMLEEENDIINTKRSMLEEERKTIDRERKLLNEREDRFAEMRRKLRAATEVPSSSEHLSLSEDLDTSDALFREMADTPKKVAPVKKKPPRPRKKEKTMPCLNCGAEVVLPEGADKATCSICNREYTIRSAKPSEPSVEMEKPESGPAPPPAVKPEARMRELSDGRLEVICENTQCENKFIVDDPSARRVHCPVCGRRIRLQ